jgi:hypothetical protein
MCSVARNSDVAKLFFRKSLREVFIIVRDGDNRHNLLLPLGNYSLEDDCGKTFSLEGKYC